jgi:membrane associated rhomboid family serine protease
MFPIADAPPSRRFPLATWAVIAANLAVFLYQVRLPAEAGGILLEQYGLVPARWFGPGAGEGGWPAAPRAFPFVSSLFLHAGWLHVLSNMWMLYIFGDNVEDRLGRLRFVVFYIVCGIAAGWAHAAVHPQSSVPAVGASGAIAGVMGAYLMLLPHARVLAVVPILFYPVFLRVPAVVFMLFWFAMQFFSGVLALGGAAGAAGIAWWAHIGGFLAGLLLAALLGRGSRQGRRIS